MAITKEELASYGIKTGSTFKVRISNLPLLKNGSFLVYRVHDDNIECEYIPDGSKYQEREFGANHQISYQNLEFWLNNGKMSIHEHLVDKLLELFGIKVGTTFKDASMNGQEYKIVDTDRDGDFYVKEANAQENDTPFYCGKKAMIKWFASGDAYDIKVAGNITPEQKQNRYPHKCIYCQSPSWNGGMNNVDCSNPDCPTRK